MAFSVTPVTTLPLPEATEFPQFIQWQGAGVNKGAPNVAVVNFVGDNLTATRGTGGHSNVITVTITPPATPPIFSTSFEPGGSGDIGLYVDQPVTTDWAFTGTHSALKYGNYAPGNTLAVASLTTLPQAWLDITFEMRVPSSSTIAVTLRVIGESGAPDSLDITAGGNGANATMNVSQVNSGFNFVVGALDTNIAVRVIASTLGGAVYLNGSSVPTATGPGYAVGFGWPNGAGPGPNDISMFHGGQDNFAGITSLLYVDNLVVRTGVGSPPTP